MRTENETCIQHITFSFPLFDEKLNTFVKNFPHYSQDNSQVEKLISLGDSLKERLRQIAAMVETLNSFHSNWRFTFTQGQLVMECEDLDFRAAIDALREQGFTEKDFVFRVEYTRKWGFL